MTQSNLFMSPRTPVLTPLKSCGDSAISTSKNCTGPSLECSTPQLPCVRRLFFDSSPCFYNTPQSMLENSPEQSNTERLVSKMLVLSPYNTELEPIIQIKEASSTNTEEIRGCNCKRSQCLKLYCDCFANGSLCKNCNCLDCHNSEEYEEEVKVAREIVSFKNPVAFSKRMDGGKKVACNCERSGCLKKYCECFKEGKKCNKECNCANCKNKSKTSMLHKGIKKFNKSSLRKQILNV